jgi:multiple sugar transport system substrate-binding protein
VPNGPSGGPGTLAEGENVYLMAGYKKPDDQKKFAEFAASPEGQKIGMNKDANGAIVRLPVNNQVDMAAERQDPRWKVFQESYEFAVYAPPVPNWAPIRQDSADTINAVWADCSADVKTAMDELNTKLTQELQSQNAS